MRSFALRRLESGPPEPLPELTSLIRIIPIRLIPRGERALRGDLSVFNC